MSKSRKKYEKEFQDYKLKIIKTGESPPCIENGILCRGCNGWRSMLKAAKEISLWQKFPFKCVCTGLTVSYVAVKKDTIKLP